MKILAAICAALLVAGCATGYQSRNITGGFEEIRIKDDVWRVLFAGNGYVTHESVQTFWLYRCAELTLEKGYDGFEITAGDKLVFLPRDGFVPVQMFDKPFIAGTIKLLKGPVTQRQPRIFDAHKLKERLEPLVKGKLCGDNVCPHFHGYLLPDV